MSPTARVTSNARSQADQSNAEPLPIEQHARAERHINANHTAAAVSSSEEEDEADLELELREIRVERKLNRIRKEAAKKARLGLSGINA